MGKSSPVTLSPYPHHSPHCLFVFVFVFSFLNSLRLCIWLILGRFSNCTTSHYLLPPCASASLMALNIWSFLLLHCFSCAYDLPEDHLSCTILPAPHPCLLSNIPGKLQISTRILVAYFLNNNFLFNHHMPYHTTCTSGQRLYRIWIPWSFISYQ